jgi:hypothetical protein
MINRYVEGEPAAELLERRWFAALRAAKRAQAECEALLEVMEVAEAAWHRTRSKLTELETLRDALGEQLAAMDGLRQETCHRVPLAVMSAA